MNHDFFTRIDQKEGKVGIGKIPDHLIEYLDHLSHAYVNHIPDTSVTTYHTYYADLSRELIHNIDTIQYDLFWDNICDANTSKYKCVTPMNEVYYSNPKPNFNKTNLYGAAANLIPHRDCILYNFQGISFYRTIIGLTDGNTDTVTEFCNLGLRHKINKGDYMIFDFDKTLHQVIKETVVETPRILLKLHYIVYDKDTSPQYVYIVSQFYIWYYIIARYTEQIGTDPTTFCGFFWGIIWEYPFQYWFKPALIGVSTTVCVALPVIFHVDTLYMWMCLYFISITSIYVSIVTGYWVRYKFTGIK